MLNNRPNIAPVLMRECRRKSSWKSIGLALSVYGGIAALGVAQEQFGAWWSLVPVLLVIAGLQNHLLILLHEGAHRLLHPNRLFNDLVADVFCAIPFFMLQINYRIIHLNHHKYSGSPARDPEVHNYAFQDYFYTRTCGTRFWRMIFFDLCGVNLVRMQHKALVYAQEMKKAGRARRIFWWEWTLFAVMWLGCVGCVLHFDLVTEFLTFWVAPQFVFLFPLLKLHGYGEHTGATGPTEYERTWVHELSPVANFFVYPIRSGLHLEHHLFPMVPWYNMGKFRSALLADDDFARRSKLITMDGLFFGKRTLWSTMLYGKGDYRRADLGGCSHELGAEVIGSFCEAEVDEQYAAAL